MSLGNVLSASYGGTKRNTFVSDADNDLLKKYKVGLVVKSSSNVSVLRCQASRSRWVFTSSLVMDPESCFTKVSLASLQNLAFSAMCMKCRQLPRKPGEPFDQRTGGKNLWSRRDL